jgi:hypothetical protein
VLYARTPTVTSDFQRLPADVWAFLDVVDWQNGAAISPDGTAYWSIFAGPPEVEAPASGGPRARPFEDAAVSTSEAAEDTRTPSISRRGRGRKPHKQNKIVEAMRSDIRDGRFTPAQLDAMLEKNLAHTYHASRDTVRKARKQIMLEFSAPPILDKKRQ